MCRYESFDTCPGAQCVELACRGPPWAKSPQRRARLPPVSKRIWAYWSPKRMVFQASRPFWNQSSSFLPSLRYNSVWSVSNWLGGRRGPRSRASWKTVWTGSVRCFRTSRNRWNHALTFERARRASVERGRKYVFQSFGQVSATCRDNSAACMWRMENQYRRGLIPNPRVPGAETLQGVLQPVRDGGLLGPTKPGRNMPGLLGSGALREPIEALREEVSQFLRVGRFGKHAQDVGQGLVVSLTGAAEDL